MIPIVTRGFWLISTCARRNNEVLLFQLLVVIAQSKSFSQHPARKNTKIKLIQEYLMQNVKENNSSQ